MILSLIVYVGIVLSVIGLVAIVKPIRWIGISTRKRAAFVLGVGFVVVATCMSVPAPESRSAQVTTRLDEFIPVWQFSEFHSARVDAPAAAVYDAMKHVRADEILFFRTLTWIRRGGRNVPESILNASSRQSLIDVALNSGFVLLADDPPRELVVGTVVVAPQGVRPLTPDVFRQKLPPGFALAAMNFVVRPDQSGGTRITTETRVFANSPGARRAFARYWRLIYPGSAIIRRMWLRAILRRAKADSLGSAFLPSS